MVRDGDALEEMEGEPGVITMPDTAYQGKQREGGMVRDERRCEETD